MSASDPNPRLAAFVCDKCFRHKYAVIQRLYDAVAPFF